ncbi:hypothetical protein C0J52_14144 [Blattella germanica]|nr:hypothetical protein C0J52_14144 [Blattella germanica]
MKKNECLHCVTVTVNHQYVQNFRHLTVSCFRLEVLKYIVNWRKKNRSPYNFISLQKQQCLVCSNDNTHVLESRYCMLRNYGDVVTSNAVYSNDTHCAVCAKVGTVFVCGNIDCFRVYCLPCIDHLAAPGSRQWVEHEEPWSCFYCKLTTRSGFIIPRTGDPSERISSLFTGGNVPPLPQKKSNCGITVLSLFDGIGTGNNKLFDILF